MLILLAWNGQRSRGNDKKSNRYTPLQPSSLARGPWVKGAVDIVGPVNGKFILTYSDYYLSYPEAHILREITSREVIQVLTDIFARFGFPEELVSNNGKQFVSAEFENFLKTCGIKHTLVVSIDMHQTR